MRRFHRDAKKAMSNFNELLTGNVSRARQALRKILRNEKGEFSPLKVYPVVHNGKRTLSFSGQILPGFIFSKVGAEKGFYSLLKTICIPIKGEVA